MPGRVPGPWPGRVPALGNKIPLGFARRDFGRVSHSMVRFTPVSPGP